MWRGEGGSGGSGEKREERRGRVALGGTVETTLSWFAQEPFLFLGMLISMRALVIVIQGVTTHTWAKPVHTHKHDTVI